MKFTRNRYEFYAFSRSLLLLYIVYGDVAYLTVKPRLHGTTGCQADCQTGWTTCWMFVCTMQPVVQPVEQPAASCKQTFNRLFGVPAGMIPLEFVKTFGAKN